MKPDQFSNIFHMEKIILGCFGSNLEPFGIFAVLAETEC